LSSLLGHSGHAIDFVVFSLHAAGVSSILGGLNFIVTFFNRRVLDLGLEKVALFV
jgi:heme/copper-type cytochrome/quinol oxidase subunit 1